MSGKKQKQLRRELKKTLADPAGRVDLFQEVKQFQPGQLQNLNKNLKRAAKRKFMKSKREGGMDENHR